MPGWLEVILRSAIGFIIVITIGRLFVRKPIGEASIIEFSFILIISLIVAMGSFHLSIPFGWALISLVVWCVGMISISYLSEVSKKVRTLFYGKGVPIVKDGKILEDNMKKQHINTDELLRKLRSKNVFQFTDVEFAVLEGNGELNVLLKKDTQPLTAKILNQNVPAIKEPETVIMDGEILDEPLATRGLSREWLQTELEKMNALVENVVLAQIDEYGQLTIDLFDDQLTVPKPTELPLLEASIKQVQADLELFSLDTEQPQVKKQYRWCAEQMHAVYQMVSPYTK
ncbi:DUF421 domain-containing protein [Halalkalibacter sp. APA_J-10(15)]|uniref:DUF421 domain-containing protein n=1 Tax=Halalkalibacter sp. APA_J-10(15) TaxID=2933805 RepID=UPI001FF2600A|nr:DUF421 domain-containing protein [Halalkalibacter sp. APA_J-10(15)]MCK0472180.1 DUF421 domain-containing protein [Halalkalibacter sp. APA_J-10(15)]